MTTPTRVTSSEQPLAELSILLVENNETFQGLVSQFLTQAGASVVSVSSVQAGLEQAQANQFHCVLCDFRLDDGDGRTLAATLQNSHQWLPVIGFSSIKLTDRQQKQLLNQGFAVYLDKPFEPAILVQEIQALVNHK